jgi:leader peptidase (prepilin peptidase) / N-methyltransferase
MDVLVFGWAMWMASSIGSFLNVAAYRIPRGLSVQGRSHCPSCRSSLSFRDNLPIFGWIFLRGRCRVCRLPISSRYPIVEASVGLTVALVVFARIYGWSLPHQNSGFSIGDLNMPTFNDPNSWALLAFHGGVLVALWLLALVRFDRLPLPPRLTSLSIVLAAAVLIVVPKFTVVSWKILATAKFYDGTGDTIGGLLRVLSALVVSSIIGGTLARRICQSTDSTLNPLPSNLRRLLDLIGLLSLAFLVIGWQSGLSLVAVSIILAAISQRLFDRAILNSKWRDPLSALAVSIPVSLSLHLFLWKTLHRLWVWPSDVAPVLTIVVWAIVALLLSSLLIPMQIPQSSIAAKVDDVSE